jgi:hypothetical protein
VPGPECCESRAVRLHLRVEQGGRESTQVLRIFRVAYHPETLFSRRKVSSSSLETERMRARPVPM